MPKTCRVFSIVLLTTLTACGGGERSESERESADPHASFAGYVQELYRALDESAVSDSVDVDIGMFGDLNVMAGENVVMGRYRYRVDTTHGDISGYLTFFARSSADDDGVPIVLVFDEEDGSWSLREASYVPSGEMDTESSPVEQILERRLDEWARGAARDASSSTIRVFP